MNVQKENNLEPSGEFAVSIQDFRSAVQHVAARETVRPVAANWLAPARQRRRSAQRSIVLGWACAALLCFATLPLTTHSRHARAPQVTQTAAASPATESDTALLEQVDTEVSEPVPSSLAPLAELENWNTAPTNTSSDSSTSGTSLRQTERTNVTH